MLIPLIKKLISKSSLTEDQKIIILAVIKDKTVKAYVGKDTIKIFVKK